ncbi:MAG: hypothetical protein ACTSPN_10375 [Promethearchaeota archaeon]
MTSEYSILMKLGGFVGSNPEILGSFPNLKITGDEYSELLAKSFPHGVKVGEFVEDKHGKHNVLSYIFKVKREEERDDLFSFSVLISKRDKTAIYKPVIKELIEILENKNLLTEEILMNNQKTIFEGINQEENIEINGLTIEFHSIFKEIKQKILKEKLALKWAFF